VSLVVGVGGLAFAGITYLWSQHEAKVSYSTATIQVVDQKQSLPFAIIDGHGQRVMENVYATNVAVWNSGDLTIDPNLVRSPLIISLAPPVRILDADIEYATDNNISEFSIASKNDNAAQIAGKYFDPKEGYRLRLIMAVRTCEK
jgi:hypothetical protein